MRNSRGEGAGHAPAVLALLGALAALALAACALLLAALVACALLLATAGWGEPSPAGAGAPSAHDAGWVLRATGTSANYAPTFVGNGYLAARVPAAGAGFSATPVRTESELAGFYARPAGQYERRAALPTWTTLGFGQLPEIYGAGVAPAPASAGSTANYRQSLDMRTGTLTTSFDWTSRSGRRTSLSYVVSANRADGHLGTVSLTAVPHWSGTATVIDEFDGRGLEQARATHPSVDGKTGTMSETVVSEGNLVTAGMTSVLRVDGGAVATTALPARADGTIGQAASFPVTAGHAYRVTKFVGVASSADTDRPLSAATPQETAAATAAGAAGRGWRQTIARNDRAWASLWSSAISVPGDTTMTAQIHAAMFYLLESARAGVTWSTSPGGLSSNGYNGHVFWDMETWMYPALLAQHPDIAVGADTYRQKLLPAAEAAAAALSKPGHRINGAKFAWESALTGVESTPPPNPEGNDEIHIDSDIALAQWQYFEVTGDTAWLREAAWPVLKGIAGYWASRAVPDLPGGYDINDVQPPDEYHDGVNNSVTTNAGARESLRIAIRAARILRLPADPSWSTVADGLKIPFDPGHGIHPEYDGYSGQTVKQADVTLLQYPWSMPMPAGVARGDLDYYGKVADVGGPSMTDAIASIDSSGLGTPGCSAYTYMLRSVDPFLSAPFDQFHEDRSGGAFTFMTGEGGYLQEFLYGFTGLRWGPDSITIAPSLPPQLPGVDLTGLKWQGRTFDLSVRHKTTMLTPRSGPSLPVAAGDGQVRLVAPGHTLRLNTRETAAVPAAPATAAAAGGPDLARCQPVSASGADPSYPAVAATDGTDGTWWRATRPGATLTVDLGRVARVSRIEVRTPSSTTAYTVRASVDGRRWVTIVTQDRAPLSTTSHPVPPAASARYIRYVAATDAIPEVSSLIVTGTRASGARAVDNPGVSRELLMS